MPLPRFNPEKLLPLLRSGAQGAPALCEKLGTSTPTLIQATKQYPNEIKVFGKTKGRRYALVQALRNGETELPVYRVDEAGHATLMAHLWVLAADEYGWKAGSGSLANQQNNLKNNYEISGIQAAEATLLTGLPYGLADCRPQGYLGRAWSRAMREFGLPDDERTWTDHDVLFALSLRGDDLPGNLIVGKQAAARLTQHHQRIRAQWITPSARLQAYAVQAQAASQHEHAAGSSVGGEQPKFLAQLAPTTDVPARSVLVKFTSELNNPIALRWADLLRAEHHALETLQLAGYAAARSELFADATRVYLECERFDRIWNEAEQQFGRRGVLSLRAFTDGEGLAHLSWLEAVKRLVLTKMFDPSTIPLTALLTEFSILIGNGDRHHGNLALDTNGPAPWSLAPAYDVLPMNYAPRSSGEMRNTPLIFETPSAESLPYRVQALPLAQSFWQLIEEDAQISPSFRQLAKENGAVVSEHARELGQEL